MSVVRRCPEHAAPNAGVLDAWPCPDDCVFFVAELERRIVDVRDNGNYTRAWKAQDSGIWFKQEFRSHQPVNEAAVWRMR